MIRKCSLLLEKIKRESSIRLLTDYQTDYPFQEEEEYIQDHKDRTTEDINTNNNLIN